MALGIRPGEAVLVGEAEWWMMSGADAPSAIPRAELDGERLGEPGSGDALDEEGQRVVLRDEGARRDRQAGDAV